MHPIKPIGDVIIVQPAQGESVSAGGIIFAPSAIEDAKHGIVLAVGGGRKLESGAIEKMDIKAGDTVLYSKFAKEHFRYKGQDLLTIRQGDVIGILS